MPRSRRRELMSSRCASTVGGLTNSSAATSFDVAPLLLADGRPPVRCAPFRALQDGRPEVKRGALGSKARVCVILLQCALTEDS
jgi:hypothetical protein